MKFKHFVWQVLAASACIVLLIEAGEFLLLTYVWAVGSSGKEVSTFELFAVFGIAAVTAILTGCLATAGTIALSEVDRASHWLRPLAGIAMVVQLGLLCVGVSPVGEGWVAELLEGKATSFLFGFVASAILFAWSTFVLTKMLDKRHG